jgi:hypothetical protein
MCFSHASSVHHLNVCSDPEIRISAGQVVKPSIGDLSS